MEAVTQKPITYQEPKKADAPKHAKKSKKQEKKKDLFLDTPLRKLGFLDEIGAAFRPVLATSSNQLIKSLPGLAYIPATIYMVADVADKYKKGEDGTGEKPSFKMGVREAAYQGVVSVLAPIGIANGVQKITKKVLDKKPKMPKPVAALGKKALDVLGKNKFTGGIIKKAGMPGKIAGAFISIFAITKLMKPVDFVTKQLFKHVVDPLIGVNKNQDK